MRKLDVHIEINGEFTFVGSICGEGYKDACFTYADEYLTNSSPSPISISLPLQAEPFSPEKTRNFFESLLPEGFSRRAVSDWIKTGEEDYLSILSVLGRECMGAIKITEGESKIESAYELLTEKRVKELAAEGASKSTQILMETHLSLAGASGKAGLFYDEKTGNWYMPKGDAASTHIVKQSHVRLKQIVLNEQLCMLAAKNVGINVPQSFILSAGLGEEEFLYATKRYDRLPSEKKQIDGLNCPYRLHQEDFAQALGIPASEKYEKTDSGYMRRMFELLRNYSSNPTEDQKELLKIIVFNHLIGNTDCHVKNFSLLYGPDLKSKRLAPAYDLLSTRIYKTTSKMSFFIGGEQDIEKLDRSHFAKASKEIGMSEKYVLDVFDDMANRIEQAVKDAASELGDLGFENAHSLGREILRQKIKDQKIHEKR